MSFNYPLGLIGLIGIPILIIIYIIKNKYTEQSISSTYIWNLSERFLKNKRPISKLYGIISLILQCLGVLIISLGIAHPILNLKNKANDYCFILDASGSMNYVENNITRFDEGKNEIKNVISSSTDGSTYTLVLASNQANVLYEKITNKEKAIELLDKASSTFSTENTSSTIAYAQKCFNDNSSYVTYLITDKDYETANINLINVAKNNVNYSLLNASYTENEEGLKIDGEVISYGTDETLSVALYIDNNLVSTQDVLCSNNQAVDFAFDTSILEFDSIKIMIENADSFKEDNEYIIYNTVKEHGYTTLIVSDYPFYLESMLKTIGNTTIKSIKCNEYNESINGYGLYIFDSYTPDALPEDGTIWMFNSNKSILGTGFSVQKEIELDEAGALEVTTNRTNLTKILLKDTNKDQFYISQYVKYGLYREYEALYTYDGNPVIFTMTSEKGNREVIFGFDLHNSNIPLLMDYAILTRNLLNYSFPKIIESTECVCGESISVNVLSSCKSIKLTSPTGKVSYLDTSGIISEYQVNEAGTYNLDVTVANEVKRFNIFVRIPEKERKEETQKGKFVLEGTQKPSHKDGIYDNLIYLFIGLALIMMADWGVYCYEQYQLR